MDFYQNYKWGLSTLHFCYRFKFICLVVVVVGGVAGELCYTLTALHLFRTLFFIRKTSSNFVYIIYFDYLTLNMFLLLSFFFGFVLRFKYGLCAMLIILSILWCCFGWMIKMIMCVTISLSLFVSFALVVLSGIPTSPIHSHAKTEPPHAPNQPPHNTNPDRNLTALPPIHPHARTRQSARAARRHQTHADRADRNSGKLCQFAGGEGEEEGSGKMELVDRMKGIALKFAVGCKAKRMKRTQWGGPACWWGVCFFLLVSRLVQSGAHRRPQAVVGCAERTMGTTLCLFECIFFEFQTSACTHTQTETKRLEYEYKSVQFE